jgi:hypothetical protein
MAIRYANYTREKSKFGGYIGSIIMHSTPGVGVNNDPTSAVFQDNLPAGYLKCDGSVRSVRDFYALAQILGVGDECRFKKDGTTLRNADEATGDLGQFQLPDLGSKVILPNRATGTYVNDTVEADGVTANVVNRVGPQIEVLSNVGNRIEVNYVGNLQVTARSGINFSGNAKYTMSSTLSTTVLGIENFQGHAHNSSQSYLNYSATHRVGSSGGKDGGNLSGNSGAGNTFEELQQNTSTASSHSHSITRPTVYNPNPFTYQYTQFNAPMDNVVSYVDIDIQNQDKLDQVVTPFILVEYLIKF